MYFGAYLERGDVAKGTDGVWMVLAKTTAESLLARTCYHVHRRIT